MPRIAGSGARAGASGYHDGMPGPARILVVDDAARIIAVHGRGFAFAEDRR